MSAEPKPIRWRHYAEYFATRIAVAFLQLLPLAWCERFSKKVGWLMADVLKFRYGTIHENLTHVFPQKTSEQRQQLNRDMWGHLFLMVCEIAQASRKIHTTNWREFVDIRDKRLMTSFYLDWRPTVMVGGHLGNFEEAVYVTGILGIPTYAIARPLDNPLLHKWLTGFRECRGQFILPTSGSATKIQEVLHAGGILSLLGDQHAGNKGCWVDFMGRPASCHKAVALFTLSQNAPMLVSY
ncbi:MAG: lysophospholipid acyltransferase family protein, partial [Pirellulaceae bacterium]